MEYFLPKCTEAYRSMLDLPESCWQDPSTGTCEDLLPDGIQGECSARLCFFNNQGSSSAPVQGWITMLKQHVQGRMFPQGVPPRDLDC